MNATDIRFSTGLFEKIMEIFRFPLAAVVLAAVVSGNAAVTDPLALWVLGARVGQSTVHLASVSNEAVMVRFGLFLVQYAIITWWILQLIA